MIKRKSHKNRVKLSDRRYETVRKRLDLPKESPSKRKFIVIQIDGLPFSTLKRFIEKGSCKNIARLMKKEDYHFQKFNCGIPSGTPAAQAGMMYGDNSMLPAFRFIDKKNRQHFSFGSPANVAFIEQKYFSKKKGILEGGSSYSNHFSGGATRCAFTMSKVTQKTHLKRLKESDIWFFVFLHPASVLRVAYYSFAELFIEALEVAAHPFIRLFRKKRAIFGFWIPFRRLLMNTIMAELITKGVIIDIGRNVPSIFVNMIGFDEVAHLRGPNSTAAYFSLRSIDRRVGRIVKKALGKYDLFIISDHGQADCRTFKELNDGMDLAEYIQKCAKVKSFGLSSAFEGRLTVLGITLRKTIEFLKYMSTPLRWTGTMFANGILRVLKPKGYKFVWDDKETIFVTDSCCMANIYFNKSQERMDQKQIEKAYPRLIEKLLLNPGIGIVLVKDKEGFSLLNREGSIHVGKSIKKEGTNFLREYGDEDLTLRQLKDFSKMEFLGDLVLFGNFKDGMSVSFTEHVGCHGGLGGDMMWPFFISKEKHDLSHVENIRELHKIFKSYS
ncbi:MAG: alkaline phosphatase family protein [Candidatus Woesearchaeota archaeon]